MGIPGLRSHGSPLGQGGGNYISSFKGCGSPRARERGEHVHRASEGEWECLC